MQEFLDSLESDIICFQETKLRGVDIFAEDDSWSSTYEGFCSFSETRKGYSGVATFVKKDTCLPYKVDLGLYKEDSEEHAWIISKVEQRGSPASVENVEKLNKEGRVVITHHDEFVLCNMYGPSISSEEKIDERMEYKMDFFRALEARLDMLWDASSGGEGLKRKVIILGDFNIAPSPMDYPTVDVQFYRPGRPDRLWIQELLCQEYVDTFRIFHPCREQAYTCWNTKLQARIHNIGSRIDLILVSKAIVEDPDISIVDADILPSVAGSDHCPVYVTLEKSTPWSSSNKPPEESLSFILASNGGKQKKIQSYFQAKSNTTIDSLPGPSESSKRLCTGIDTRPQKATIQISTPISFSSVKHDEAVRDDETLSEFLVHEYKASQQYFAKRKDEAKIAWDTIQHRYIQAPLCFCNISAAKKKVTKSSSKKKGKWFYCCSKPVGGGQCTFFQWIQ